jgi:hypothetical protein
MGSAIPAASSTKKKKNNQRGPRVGKVNKVTSANPPPPSKMRMRKAGRKSLKVAVALGGVSIDEIISYFALKELFFLYARAIASNILTIIRKMFSFTKRYMR